MKRFPLSILLIYVLFIQYTPLLAQWESMNGPFAGSASLPVSNGTSLFICNSSGAFRSDDGGDNWVAISENLKTDRMLRGIQVMGNTILVSAYPQNDWIISHRELFISFNSGQNWQYIPYPITNLYSSSYLLRQDRILLLADGAFWEFPFNKMRWQPKLTNNLAGYYTDLFQYDGKIFITGWEKIAESSDEGNSWTYWNTSQLPIGEAENCWVDGNTMFVTRYVYGSGGTTSEYKTYKTVNHGLSWSAPIKFNGTTVRNILQFNGRFFGIDYYGLLSSDNQGLTWTRFEDTPPNIDAITSVNNALYVLSGENATLYKALTAVAPAWKIQQKGIKGGYISAVYANDNILLAASKNGGIHRYRKNTDQWSLESLTGPTENISAINTIENNILAASSYGSLDSGFIFSPDNGLNWGKSNTIHDFIFSVDINQIVCNSNRCFAYNDSDFSFDQDCWETTNKGESWLQTATLGKIKTYEGYFYRIASSGDNLEISLNGSNWFPLTSDGIVPGEKIKQIYTFENAIYLWADGLNGNDTNLYYSNDDGFTWAKVFSTSASFFNVPSIRGRSDFLIMNLDGMYHYSNDHGYHWYPLPPNEQIRGNIYNSDQDYIYGAPYYVISKLLRLPIRPQDYRQVTIKSFHDINQNGQWDTDEKGIPGAIFWQPSNGYLTTVGNNGRRQFTMRIPAGITDSIHVAAPEYFSLVPALSVIPVTAQDTAVLVPFVANPQKDLGVFMGQTRPLLTGFSSAAIVAVKNTGGHLYAGGGQVILEMPTNLPGIQYDPQPDQMQGNLASWSIPDLGLDSVFVVRLRFPSPNNAPWDEIFRFKVGIEGLNGDELPENNQAVLELTPFLLENPFWITANKRTVSEQEVAAGKSGLSFCSGFESIFSTSSPISTVDFFQEFRPDFDLNEFRFITASHPAKINMRSNGIMSFQLKTTHLPDTSAGEASRCFALYTMAPAKQLKKGDLLSHFSITRFNANTSFVGYQNIALVNIDDGTNAVDPSFFEPTFHLSVSPNPSNGTFSLDTHGVIPEDALITISDISGKVFYSERWNGGEISAPLAAGVYFLHLMGKNGAGFCKLMILK